MTQIFFNRNLKMADHAHSAEELAPYTEEENKIYFVRESDWTQCPAYLFGQEGTYNLLV